ncbi:MAG: hypothetical protein ABI036_19555 [Fibrobacteria bacterium]
MLKTKMALRSACVAAIFAANLVSTTQALNIQDIVQDKLYNGVEAAKVCLISDSAICALTNEDGEFAIADGIIAVRHPGQGSEAFRLESGAGGLTLYAPVPARAKVQWLDAGGRSLSTLGDRPLAQGRNPVSFPDGLRNSGLCFLRVYLSDMTLTWKTVLLEGAVSAIPSTRGGSGSGIRAAALSKVQAGPAGIVISKSGYKTRTYRPFREAESGEIIILTAADDDNLPFTTDIVTSITTLDMPGKTIITQSVENYCEGNDLRADTLTDTTIYSIRNGKMYVWNPGDCYGTILAGPSLTPVATWTLSQVEAALPVDLQANGCAPDSSEPIAEGSEFQVIYDITATKITAHFTYPICPSDAYRENFEGELLLDPDVVVTKVTCKEIGYRNGDGETAKVLVTQAGDSVRSVFTYGSKTCAFSKDMSLSNNPVSCSDDGDPFYEHLECLYASGFVTVASKSGLAKSSAAASLPALPMSRLGQGLPGKASVSGLAGKPSRPFSLIPRSERVSRVSRGLPNHR